MTIGCASQGKRGKPGKIVRINRNNQQIEDAQDDLRDLQDQLDDLEGQLRRNGNLGQINPNAIPPGIINPGQVNPGDQLLQTPPGTGGPGGTPSLPPGVGPGQPSGASPDTTGSPLRAFQAVDQVFRRAQAEGTHGGAPTPSVTATNDQPALRRRVE